MASSIHVTIQDEYGGVYTLDSYRIDFGDVMLGDISQKRRVIVHNTNRAAIDIEIECIAHPTGQVGSPADTYEVARLDLDSEGPFASNKVVIGAMSPNESVDLWIKWPIGIESLPGWGVFALEATGQVNL